MPEQTLTEYTMPEWYDLEMDEFESDGPFFLEFARQAGGAVLELGCGTGRITIPLAQQGIDITGLDIAPEMIAFGKRKPGAELVKWVTGDARTFDLGREYRLIFEVGCVFQHMVERRDQEALLAQVKKHLAPEGFFVVGAMIPHPGMMENVDKEEDWFSYPFEGGEVRVSGTQYYDPIRQVKVETAYRRWKHPDGNERETVSPLALRLFFPQELEALLHYNGFYIDARYGDCQKNPLSTESRMMFFVARKKLD